MGIKLLFGVFYRPPNTDIQYLRSLRSSLDRVNNTKAEKIFLVGDFNLPNFDWTNQLPCSFELIYIETFEMLNDAFLTQVNTEPTRGRILWHDIIQFRCHGSGTTLKQDK
jgi:hypothetical protein